jgi:hypothetical protein
VSHVRIDRGDLHLTGRDAEGSMQQDSEVSGTPVPPTACAWRTVLSRLQ